MRIAGFLIAGILLGEQVGDCLSLAVWLAALGVSVVVAFLLSRHGILQTCVIFLCTVIFGIALTANQHRKQRVELPEEPMLYKAVLLSEPEERGKIVRFDMQVLTGELQGCRVKATLLRDTVNHLYRRIHVGDGILVSSRLETPANYAKSTFDYAAYLRNLGFSATTFISWNKWRKVRADITSLSLTERTRLTALRCRGSLVEKLREAGLADDELALTAALTLGDKSLLDKGLKDDFSVSGGSHVLALSGLHLSIIYGMLSFFFLGYRRRMLAQVLILTAVWTFVVLVGMSASVMRSAMMLTVYSVVSLLHRNKMSLNTLALAAIILLVANPQCIYDVGFQMSFVSVFFILFWFDPVYHWVNEDWLRSHRIIAGLWAMIVISFVAQLGVGPLVAHYFHRFSCYFLLSNFVVVPCATVILYLTAALFLLIPLQHILASVISVVAHLMIVGVRWISALPGSSVGGLNVSGLQVILLYVFMFSVYFLIKRLYRYRIL